MPVRQTLGEIRLGGLRRNATLLVFSLSLPFLFQACAFISRTFQFPRSDGIYHVVNRGENLFRIGKAYDFTYQELARINGIDNPHKIETGQRVFIPGATRQLPVEIITPASVSLERPRAGDFSSAEADGFIWPVRGEVSSRFGQRGDGFHDGVDIMAAEGSPVLAAESGEVIYSDRLRGYGNIVIIRHGGGLLSVYAHNRRNRVTEGDRVAKGDIIAEVGDTGRASSPHLHFEIRKDNVALDPLYYLQQ